MFQKTQKTTARTATKLKQTKTENHLNKPKTRKEGKKRNSLLKRCTKKETCNMKKMIKGNKIY